MRCCKLVFFLVVQLALYERTGQDQSKTWTSCSNDTKKSMVKIRLKIQKWLWVSLIYNLFSVEQKRSPFQCKRNIACACAVFLCRYCYVVYAAHVSSHSFRSNHNEWTAEKKVWDTNNNNTQTIIRTDVCHAMHTFSTNRTI